MTESNKGSVAANKAWSSEREIVDKDVEKELSDKEKDRENDTSDEVSFYRQTKFSKTDAENITKKALGNFAFKRPDKHGAYKEVSTLSPDIQNLWKKIENKRITGKSQISYARNLLRKEGITAQEKTRLESDLEALDERDAAFKDIENIILNKKNPNEILKAIQSLSETHSIYRQEFQEQIEEHSGNIRAQAGLQRLNIGINILLNFKSAISKIINTKEENMTPKESSIIDSELKIKEDEKDGGGIEQGESPQEVVKVSKSEIANIQDNIQTEAENNKANIKQKSETIKDPLVKDQILVDTQKSNNEVVSNGIRISKESLEKLNEIKNGQKSEAEIKNPEIQALQKRADEELRSTESALSIFEKGKSDELDSLVSQLAAKMGVRGDLKSDGARGYIKSGLEDRKKVLYRTRALLSQSKSPEEFYGKINNELDQLSAIKNSESEQIAKEKDINKKGKEEKKINNKYNFRKETFTNYFPSKKEEQESVAATKAPVEARPTIDKSTDQEKIDNLREGIANAKAAGDDKTVSDLEKMVDKLAQRNIEEKSYKQEWKNLHEQIKQADKEGKSEDVKRLEQEIYKLEQKKRDEKVLAGEKDKEARKKEKISALENELENLRVKITEAEKANKNDEVVELENSLREVQKEKRRAEGKEDEKESTIIKGYRYNHKKNTNEEIDIDISKLSEDDKKAMIKWWVNDGRKEKSLESVGKIVDSLKDDKEREEYGIWIKEKELTPGDFVKVKRSDGRVDDYWEYKGIDPETGRAIVISERFENGKENIYRKLVLLDELKSLNGKGKPVEAPKVEAKGEEVKKEQPAEEFGNKIKALQAEINEIAAKRDVLIERYKGKRGKEADELEKELNGLNAEVRNKLGEIMRLRAELSAVGNKKDSEKSQEPVKEVEEKKEEPKEKTAEEILREKNIEVYGGEEKLNQIFEDYKRLNELEDREAYDNRSPLFSEWDALRVKIANINLEVIGKDRVVNSYKIQNKDEKIREYFNTKLDEPFESFKRDIEKESPAEWAMRAATLIKYRNELKNCDWQKKDKYRDIPREKYVEIIKWLEQRIGMLNEKLPKKEGASPEAALKDLSIDDFQKIEKEPGYKGGLPAVIEGEKVKTEMTADQTAKVENVLKEFNLTAEDAEKVEGFKDLSYGQKLLALENLRQLTLRKVRDQALAENQSKTSEVAGQYAKTKGWRDGRWRKGWLDKVPAGAKLIQQGMTKYFSIARGKRRIKKDLSKEDYEEVLRDVVEGMKKITEYDVEEKEGKLEVQYLSGLENLNDQEKVNVNRLNEIANELGRMPLSLEQLPMGLLKDKHTRAQKSQYEKLRAEYDQLLKGETEDGKSNQGILGLLERQARLDLKKEGEDDSDREVRIKALTQAGELENIIRLNRFFIENPDAEKELKKIESFWKNYSSVLKDTLAERGALFGFGLAARTISIKALTALGVASSVGPGVVIWASAAGIGGGIGGWRGWRRAEESLREMDAQMRGKDFKSKESKGISREILMQKQRERQEQRESAAKKGEVAYKTITNKKGETIKLTGVFELSKEERIEKNIVDADGLTNRLNEMKEQIDQTSYEIGKSVAKEGQEGLQTKELIDKRFELAHRLEVRLGYTRRKLDGGLVNFGKNEEQAFNQMTLIDRLNLAVSYVELYKKPTTEKKPDEPSLDSGEIKSKEDKKPLTLEQRLERFLNFKSKKISQARKWHKLGQMGKGAAYGMVFAGAGASVRWFLEHYYGGGQIPPQEKSVPAGGGAGYESAVNQGTGSEKVKSVMDQFNEDFRHHPEWKTDPLEKMKALSGLQNQLESAGVKNPDALSEIISGAKNQLNGDGNVLIVKGGFQEAQNLPGIDSTGGNGGAEHAAAAAGAGKTVVEGLVGAKQDSLASAVETASGKMNSVWKMIGHQLDQRGIFKGLAGTPEEIAAKKTYMIDYFKDMVAKDPKGFGLEDIDDLRVGQKVDLSKLFESHPRLGEIIRDTNALPASKITSILEHNHRIADFHHLHPGVRITSENVDQIAAGHGDALLKKVAEQAVSEQIQPSASEAIIQPESPQVPHHPASPYEDMLRNNIEGRIKEVQRLTDETVGERLNKIFDYAFGRQGAETSTYQDIKNEIADHFLKRNLSGEPDINDPFAIDSDDARRYGELQEYLKELIRDNHSVPKIGETVEVFMKRVVGDTIQEDVNKLLNLPK